uniref:Uncharacterized protein n=1 Tax=Plectus sambesii TaxID=2011161 RepID=A0A914VHV4_9BILA
MCGASTADGAVDGAPTAPSVYFYSKRGTGRTAAAVKGRNDDGGGGGGNAVSRRGGRVARTMARAGRLVTRTHDFFSASPVGLPPPRTLMADGRRESRISEKQRCTRPANSHWPTTSRRPEWE